MTKKKTIKTVLDDARLQKKLRGLELPYVIIDEGVNVDLSSKGVIRITTKNSSKKKPLAVRGLTLALAIAIVMIVIDASIGVKQTELFHIVAITLSSLFLIAFLTYEINHE